MRMSKREGSFLLCILCLVHLQLLEITTISRQIILDYSILLIGYRSFYSINISTLYKQKPCRHEQEYYMYFDIFTIPRGKKVGTRAYIHIRAHLIVRLKQIRNIWCQKHNNNNFLFPNGIIQFGLRE